MVDPAARDLARAHESGQVRNPGTARAERLPVTAVRRNRAPAGVVVVAVLGAEAVAVAAQLPGAPLVTGRAVDQDDLRVAAGGRLGAARDRDPDGHTLGDRELPPAGGDVRVDAVDAQVVRRRV